MKHDPFEPPPSWDLSSILPGSTSDLPFTSALDAVERMLRALDLGEAPLEAAQVHDLEARIEELYAFAMCRSCEATDDVEARRAVTRCANLHGRVSGLWARVERIEDQNSPGPTGAHVHLRPDLGTLATALREDAASAWSDRYDRIFGQLQVTIGGRRLAVSQAVALSRGDTDPEARRAACDGLASAWSGVAEDCAEALGHIVGFRRVVNDWLAVDELEEPLHNNRIERATVEAMLAAAREFRPVLRRYLVAKAQRLGKERMDWWDLWAPLPGAPPTPSWSQARALMDREFGAFSPRMAAFTREVFARRWIDAEARGGKRSGAFCMPFPRSGQVRVLLSWEPGGSSLRTLAHELGHAYHFHALRELPPSQRRVPFSLAETASNFAEGLIRSANLARATEDRQRLALYDAELADAVGNLITIPSRYELERELHVMRRQGPLVPDELSHRTETLQRAAFGDALGVLDPLYWASAMHLYLSDRPFYSFPFTFGFLFSGLVRAQAAREGRGWHERYDALLRDTGELSCEELAWRHLGADLREPGVWAPVLASIRASVERFEELADDDHRGLGRISTSSTSNCSAAPPGMTGGEPWSP